MHSITYLESIASSNDAILGQIRAGSAAPGEVIVAREQTRGRGRMGRQWSSKVGGLWFTAAMPVHGEHLGWAGMLAALAVCRALDEIGLRAGVKWPNDVVVDGKKLAGVLVEMVAGRELAAVGVGLNVRNPLPPVVDPGSAGGTIPLANSHSTQCSHDCRSAGRARRSEASTPGAALHHAGPARTPAITRELDSKRGQIANGIVSPASDRHAGRTPALPGSALWPPTSVMEETGRDLDPWSLLEPILGRMDELWRVWKAGDVAEMQAAWLARDVSRGRRVRLLPDGPEGLAAGIDLTGSLCIRLPDGRESLARAGELLFLDSAASQP